MLYIVPPSRTKQGRIITHSDPIADLRSACADRLPQFPHHVRCRRLPRCPCHLVNDHTYHLWARICQASAGAYVRLALPYDTRRDTVRSRRGSRSGPLAPGAAASADPGAHPARAGWHLRSADNRSSTSFSQGSRASDRVSWPCSQLPVSAPSRCSRGRHNHLCRLHSMQEKRIAFYTPLPLVAMVTTAIEQSARLPAKLITFLYNESWTIGGISCQRP